MDEVRREVRSAFARQQEGLGDSGPAKARILQKMFGGQIKRRSLSVQLAGAVATFLVAGSIATAVVLIHGHFHARSQTATPTLEQSLTAGPAAFVTPGSSSAFVWLIGPILKPSPATGPGRGQDIGTNVEVLDWTGAVRYNFEIPNGQGPTGIQSISADGTRALLDDGTVLDETGSHVGAIPSLKNIGMPAPTVRWMSNDRNVCAAFSNEPVAPFVTPPPKGQPNPSPTAPEPYTLPGANHSVTLKVFGIDGSVRTIATVGAGPLTVPSGAFGDSPGVLSCNPAADLAVVARYHDADTSPADAQSTTYMTVSIWAVKLSTGQVVYHQPETRMALGRAFFFGSQDASLAVEFLWNGKVWGCESDILLRMPSGTQVPVLDSEPCPDTPGVSSDGTRILRRIVYQGPWHTAFELIDASDGRIIRRVEAPGIFGASAVAQPGGSSFMVQVDRYLALVDASGGITLLHPDVVLNQGGPGGVSLPYASQG